MVYYFDFFKILTYTEKYLKDKFLQIAKKIIEPGKSLFFSIDYLGKSLKNFFNEP